MRNIRLAPLLFAALLCSCSHSRALPEPLTPPAAHSIASDGTPVSGAPEPEVVRLRKIEQVDQSKHVTVGNVAGDYELVCNLSADSEIYGVASCLSPEPDRDYLLFRANTKWLINGGKNPTTLEFMEDFSVVYDHDKENIALMPAKKLTQSDHDRPFGMYWLLSRMRSSGPR